MEATWSLGLGVLIIIVAIILATIFYFKYNKVSSIFYIASIATYIFSVFYTWDVFELTNNQVLVMLLLSTVLMFGLGKYFTKLNIIKNEKKK